LGFGTCTHARPADCGCEKIKEYPLVNQHNKGKITIFNSYVKLAEGTVEYHGIDQQIRGDSVNKFQKNHLTQILGFDQQT
jgi:hypothetical protein